MSTRILDLLASYIRQSRSMSFGTFSERRQWILSRVSLCMNKTGDAMVNIEDLILFVDNLDTDALYDSV